MPTSYVIYAAGYRPPDQYPRNYVPVFDRADQARLWLMTFLNGKPYTRVGNVLYHETDPGYTTNMAVTLRSDQLDAILQAPVANEELDAQAKHWILRFKHGTWDEVHETVVEATDTTPEAVRVKQEKTARDKAPDGWITITEICAGTGIKPMYARAALRAVREKPSFGWAFDPKELIAIKRLIGVTA